MGNHHCCKDTPITNYPLILEEQISKQYYETQLPDDEEIKKKYEHITTNPQFASLFNSRKVLKHKYLDRYFLGTLNSDGLPVGLGILYEPQSLIYHGAFNNSPNGEGTLQLFKQELIYKGAFKQGKADGLGTITSIDKRIQFIGTMQNSYPKSGTLKINHNDAAKSCSIQFQNFPTSPAKLMFGDGRLYEGHINKKTFAPEGKGIAYFNDHSHYQGQFEQGQMHGKGSFYWPDGSSYHGSYQHGKKHGDGTFNYSSGKYYEGSWVNGKQHGEGALYEATKKLIKRGLWKSGKFQGQQ